MIPIALEANTKIVVILCYSGLAKKGLLLGRIASLLLQVNFVKAFHFF